MYIKIRKTTTILVWWFKVTLPVLDDGLTLEESCTRDRQLFCVLEISGKTPERFERTDGRHDSSSNLLTPSHPYRLHVRLQYYYDFHRKWQTNLVKFGLAARDLVQRDCHFPTIVHSSSASRIHAAQWGKFPKQKCKNTSIFILVWFSTVR